MQQTTHLARRALLLGGGSGLMAAQYRPKRKYRVAVIGHTGRGNYGHAWEMAWQEIPEADVVALADPDERGRTQALARSGARRGYASYADMISKEKPDIVTIGPRWLDQRVDMVRAATDAGAHILMEKPFARSLAEADQLVAMIERKGVKAQVGHSARVMPVTPRARDLVAGGQMGTLLEVRARGKEDRRAGGEDMMVLGTHCFDLMRYFAGDPQWVFAHMTQQGKEVRPPMLREASEPIGPIAADSIAAMFLFAGGVHGYFGSMASDVKTGRRFGVTLHCSKGYVVVPLTDVPSAPPWVLRNPAWVPEKGEAWERVEYPPEPRMDKRERVNHLMALDLIEAIEAGREPICSARDGRWTVEMVTAIYQSQMSGARVEFPLKKRAS